MKNLSEVLKKSILATFEGNMSYVDFMKQLIGKFNNKYNNKYIVTCNRCSNFINKPKDIPFSLDLKDLKDVDRFDLIGCQGISGRGGSLQNYNIRGYYFKSKNKQWAVSYLASKNREKENVRDKTLTLLLGDNFYSDGLGHHKRFSSFNPATSKTFAKNFTNMEYGRSYAILGNHDWGLWSKGSDENSEYKLKLALNQVYACYDDSDQTKDWNMPNRYYHFTTDKADFYCIDSTSYCYDKEQQGWLRSIYDKQNELCKNKWQILVSHHALISIAKRNPYNTHNNKAQRDGYKYSQFFQYDKKITDFSQFPPFETHNELLRKALCQFKFDIVLSAHDHTLAGYYINTTINTDARNIADPSRPLHQTFQVVSGGGGAHIEKTREQYIKVLKMKNYLVQPNNPKDRIVPGIIRHVNHKNNPILNEGYLLNDTYGYVCMYIHKDYIDFDYHMLNNGHDRIRVNRIPEIARIKALPQQMWTC